MKLSDFHFDLPDALIAQQPSPRRDESRLMVVQRGTGTIEHTRFRDIARYVSPRDLFVLNNTRVIPARLSCSKSTGGRVEVLLLRQVDRFRWEGLLRPGRRCKKGTRLFFLPGQFEALVEGEAGEGTRILRFDFEGDFQGWLEKLGRTPLPPYIRRSGSSTDEMDRLRYQTVYACHAGSVAAPTAGLHFTPELLQSLRSCEVTLHVGYGTFRPIQCDRIEEHRMDPERFSIGEAAAGTINGQLQSGGRVIAVGTTTTRTLEHRMLECGEIRAGWGETDLFIYPGFDFRVIGGLVTNFHLPGSTLLLLVAAFAGREFALEAYRTAVEESYRFYSFGDAMLIL